MDTKNLLGYEIGTGKPVYVKPHHLIITGMTGESGKTTTLEALLSRGQLTGLAFRTKRGELGFEQANRIQPYFSEQGLTQWRALEGLLSATLGEKVQREPGVRGAIIRLCSGASTLEEVYRRNSVALNRAKGFQQDVHEKIRAYLDLVMPQLKETPLSSQLVLARGRLNIMDLEGLSEEMQNLVIFASTSHIYNVEKNVVLVIPEAAKFIPQDRGSPCKVAIEKFVREGRAVGNWLWIDSQDMRGVDKKYLRHCDNWILGRQRLMLEVEATLDAIPVPRNLKPKPEEVQQLELGHFIACLHNDVKRVYVMPSWLNEGQARNVALGQMKPPPKPQPVGVAEVMEMTQTIGKLVYDSAIEQQFRELGQKIEGLRKGLDFMDERVRSWEKWAKNLQDWAEKATVKHASVQGNEATIEFAEQSMKVIHTEDPKPVLSTKNAQGKIMWVLLNDLESGKAIPLGFDADKGK